MTLAYAFYFLPSWNHVKFPNRHLTRSRSLREFFIGNSVKIFLLRDYGQSQYFYVPITSYFAFSFSIFFFFQQRYFIEYENDLPSNERKNCLGTRKGGPYPKKGMAYFIYLLHNRSR